MVRNRKRIYLDACLKEIPRLLGQIDKNQGSPTYGCFDRLYWHFRVRDFPGTIPQYATLTLALLYTIKAKHNPWYKNQLIKKYASAAMLFWAKMQNKNGSFNEAYPNDKSQPATAFSLYFVGEAYRLLRKELNDGVKKIMNRAMNKAAEFVWRGSESFKAKRGDPEVPNHDAGSVNALYLMYLLTKNEKYKKRAKVMLRDLLKLQTEEGWFSEYGGADIGYSTFMLFWLANYHKMSKDKEVVVPINKLIEFLSYFIHPDGSLGGEYGSRTTYFYIPAGFEIASWNKKATSIAEFMINAINKKAVLVPERFDDANLLSFPFFSLLLAYNNYAARKRVMKLPCQEKDMCAWYKESKLFVIKNNRYYAVISGSKGVIKAFKVNTKNPELVFTDTGWISSSNKRISSSIFNPHASFVVSNGGKNAVIKTNFSKAKFQYASPFKLAISRIIFPVASNYPFLKKILKALLRKLVITGQKKVSVRLIREINFLKDKIEIKDKITGNRKYRDFYSTGNFTDLWSYPGGLFRKQEDLMHEKEYYVQGAIKEVKF